MRRGTHAWLRAVSCVLLSTSAAWGQDRSEIYVEISRDNVEWSTFLASVPGETIYSRVRVAKQGPTAVVGFAGMTCQPAVVSPEILGLSVVGPVLTDGVSVALNSGLPANLGRITPFGLIPMGTATSFGGLRAFQDVTMIRFSGANNLTLGGNIALGVRFLQRNQTLAGAAFNSGASPTIFKYAVMHNGTVAGLYSFTVPIAGITPVGAPALSWYTTAGGAQVQVPVSEADIHPATLYVGGAFQCLGTVGAHPQPATVRRGGTITLSTRASMEGSPCELSYWWYRDGVLLANDERTSGQGGRVLTITGARATDGGIYHVEIVAADSTGVSHDAAVRVCVGDFDQSGGVDGDDVIAFFGAWDAGLLVADVDASGGVDGDDIIRFFSDWDASC